MTKEITMSEDELRQKLEIALEGGRELGAREALSKAAQGSSKDQIRAEFRGRVADLGADNNRSPAKLRKIQAEFMEAGLTWENVDVAPRGSAVDARPNDMNSAMAFRRRR